MATARTPTSKHSGAAADDLGKLLLRVVLGVLLLLHGIAKVISGPAAIIGLTTRAGLPGAVGYLVYVGEVLAPLLLIVGLWSRAAGLIVAINMVFAVALAHRGELLSLTKNGGWALELQGLYLLCGLVVALIGAGRYSLGGRQGPLN